MTVVVTNEHRKPVAVAPDMERARNFVHRNVGWGQSATTWTETGKLYVNGRWTGWEVKEVRAV